MNKVVFFLCSVLALGCNYKHRGLPGASNSIEESKSNGHFIAEYYVKDSFLKTDKNYKAVVKSAFLERQWRYGNFKGQTIPDEGYHFMVEFQDGKVINYPMRFTIGIDPKNYFRPYGRNTIICDMDSLPKGDSIEWVVQQYYTFSESEAKVIIGKAVLFKK